MRSHKNKPMTDVSMADIATEKEGKDQEQALTALPIVKVVDLPEDISHMPVGELSVKRPFWRRVSSLSREQVLIACAFWGVVLLGAILRCWGLGDRPLHHDESLHGYFSLQLLQNNIEKWSTCFTAAQNSCYRYDPLLHGPFQFHAIAIVYMISRFLGVWDHGVNTTTVRIAAASLGSVIVGLPYFLRHYLGKIGAWLACFLLAVSPSMVYFSRFAREDIYMACFTLLLVVGTAQYMRTRSIFWFIVAALAFSLSYATKEATFLTIAVFGSFFGALLAWELGTRWSFPLQFHAKQLVVNASETATITDSTTDSETNTIIDSETPTETNNARSSVKAAVWPREMLLPRSSASITLLCYLIVLGAFAKWFFGWLKNLSVYITANTVNTNIANDFVAQLKARTQVIVPWLGIVLALVVVFILFREQGEKPQSEERRGLAKWVDPKKQPLLDTIVTMPWQHMFFGLVLAWTVFIVLFTALFTNIPNGIGDGIWQGIYYWIQQQQVARGGQPWYYYFMLIPLYEQIGLVFGLLGIISCCWHPSRFRLFLVYWFLGNVLIYSWAGEKMPWLMIHMTMPLMLLAAIGLQPVVIKLCEEVKGWRAVRLAKQAEVTLNESSLDIFAPQPRSRMGGRIALGGAVFGAIVAVCTLVLTLQNMVQVVYVHPADGPHEMMIYVQTTPDINTIMAKIDVLDQQWSKTHQTGRYQLPIGVMNDATWPFAWYLRDYTHTCFQFPNATCSTTGNLPVLISGGDNTSSMEVQYGQQYAYHQYEMRSQWDQGYMPPPCVGTLSNPCSSQQYTGVGLLPWLSYGNHPPHPGQFHVGLIAQNVWQWWWHRTPMGGIDSGYSMVLFIQKNAGVRP